MTEKIINYREFSRMKDIKNPYTKMLFRSLITVIGLKKLALKYSYLLRKSINRSKKEKKLVISRIESRFIKISLLFSSR